MKIEGRESMHETKHYRLRLQQRSISKKQVSYVLKYGSIYRARGKAWKAMMTKQAYMEARHDAADKKLLEKCRNVAVVVSHNNSIITAYYLR